MMEKEFSYNICYSRNLFTRVQQAPEGPAEGIYSTTKKINNCPEYKYITHLSVSNPHLRSKITNINSGVLRIILWSIVIAPF